MLAENKIKLLNKKHTRILNYLQITPFIKGQARAELQVVRIPIEENSDLIYLHVLVYCKALLNMKNLTYVEEDPVFLQDKNNSNSFIAKDEKFNIKKSYYVLVENRTYLTEELDDKLDSEKTNNSNETVDEVIKEMNIFKINENEEFQIIEENVNISSSSDLDKNLKLYSEIEKN